MKKNRSDVEAYLAVNSLEILKGKSNDLYAYCHDKYNYPASIISDYIGKRMSFSEASEFELFILVDGFNKCLKYAHAVEYYFTDQEVNTYGNEKWEKRKRRKFPLKFRMIEVCDDQWIGTTTAKEILELRNSQLISYNENIQRTLQHVVRGKKETYIIKLNKSAVNSITESMERETFIPNTLTLNIPFNENSDFYYDPETLILTIKSADSLDIIDGYHRMVAITNASYMNPNFDYPMELRITNFQEDKGQRFVYQEDQKTQMTKKDSDSYNVDDEAVKFVKRLNNDSLFRLQGEVNRNKGLINFGDMAAIVRRLWFYKASKKEVRKISFDIYEAVRDNLNNLITHSDKYFLEKYTFRKLAISMITVRWCMDNNYRDIGKVIDYVDANINKIDNRKGVYGLTAGFISDVENLIKEGVG